VTSNLIKSNREKYKGFFVANDLIESVMHLLYPLVTFGEVKEKYKEKLYTFSKSPEYVELIESILGKKIGARIISEIQEENWVALQHEAGNVRKYLFKKTFLNISFFRLKIFINFFITIFYRTVGKNGIVISFTGIDGAGKTSIKEHLINNSDKYFTKNRKIEFYWRPFLLPRVAQVIGSKGQKETLDGSGKRVVNSGLISSFKNLMKYFYYAADFIFGQIKYFKEAHTGGLVIFDRYHFDNIIYPERFGFKVNRIIMRMFDKVFIPQPDRLFYFTADAQVLFDRKHEIDIDEINAQKKIYSTEMNFNKNVITIDTGCSFNDSINNVLLECLEFMSNRYNKHG
jgi:thymidylate kinase